MHGNKENPLKEALLVKEEGICMTAFSHLLSAFSQDTTQGDKTLKTTQWISYPFEPYWAVFVDFFFKQGLSANYLLGHYTAVEDGVDMVFVTWLLIYFPFLFPMII